MKNFILKIMMCLISGVFLIGCSSSQEEYVKETHKRDEYISRNFETMTLNDGEFTYHIEMNKEDIENGNLEAYKEQLTEVKEAQQSIEKLLGNVLEKEIQEPIEIYFLENTNNYEGWNDVVVIEKDLIMTEELTYHLLSKLYDCEEWVAYGVSKYLLGESADEAYLQEYYSEKENVADLSLFGVKFYDLNPDKEEQKAVRETAISLFTYILTEHKTAISALFDMSENGSEQVMKWKNDWLKARGILEAYENEKEGVVRQLRFVSAVGRYPVLMKFENYVFYLNDAMFEAERMETLDSAEKEFLGAFADVMDIEKYLFENLSEDILQKIQNRKQSITKCYFKTEESTHSDSYVMEWKIHLSEISSFPHESVHNILIDNSNHFEIGTEWIKEGLAEYLAVSLYGKNRSRALGTKFEQYYLNWDNLEPAESVEYEIARNHNKEVFELYLSEGGKLGETGFDYVRFSEIYLYTEKCISNPEDKPWVKYDGLSGVYGMQLKNGTGDWSYMECMEFVEYLVERFGIQKVMEVNYEPKRIEEILGDTLMNLHKEWEKIFMEENKDLQKYLQ